MTVFLHELRRARLSLLIWSAAIAFMLAVSVLIFPEMAPQMSQMEDMMSNMGSFSDAFGMNDLSFAHFTDYFSIECGNVMGLGGAVFAAITGVLMLSKEEKEHTAEFLFTHPLSRSRIVLEKLLALAAQIVILTLVSAAASLLSIAAIGEHPDFTVIWLLFLAYLLMELEIALLCFGISAFMKNGLGVGLGLAIGLYFLNILSNITNELDFLKYITPFAYTESAYILQNHALRAEYAAIGAALGAAAAAAAFIRYRRKDLN